MLARPWVARLQAGHEVEGVIEPSSKNHAVEVQLTMHRCDTGLLCRLSLQDEICGNNHMPPIALRGLTTARLTLAKCRQALLCEHDSEFSHIKQRTSMDGQKSALIACTLIHLVDQLPDRDRRRRVLGRRLAEWPNRVLM